jgi:hypothetical protein
MSSTSKGRWVAFATVVIVTTAWSVATRQIEAGWDCKPLPPTLFVSGGFCVGLPYGWLVGTIVGRLAGRLERARALIIVAAIIWALLADLVVAAFAGAARCTPEPPAAALFVLSIVPTIVGAIVLERWTRPVDRVPRARIATGCSRGSR